MEPTIFMAWLSDTEGSGGWWTPEAREEAHYAKWSPRAPRHLSFHTSREGAEAALTAAAKDAWEADECSYSHGAWGGDDRADNSDLAMLLYMSRHAGYEAHVTEQPVHIDGGAAVQAIADAAREAFGVDVELVFHAGDCEDGS